MKVRGRGGFSLVEVMVVIAVLSIALGLAAVAMPIGLAEAREDEALGRLRGRRAAAIDEGRLDIVWPDSAHAVEPVLVLPDGRTVGQTVGEPAR